MNVILKDMQPDDWIFGIRAAKWLHGLTQKDAIISYGDGAKTVDVYVKRNKASITARLCNRAVD